MSVTELRSQHGPYGPVETFLHVVEDVPADDTPDDDTPSDLDLLLEALNNEEFLAMCDEVCEPPAPVGRRRKYHPIVGLLISTLVNDNETQADAIRTIKSHWSTIRPLLAARFPGYPGFEPGAAPPSRHNYRHIQRTHKIFEEKFRPMFRRWSAGVGITVGIGQDTHSSFSRPSAANTLAIDGTVLSPLISGSPGPRLINAETGECDYPRFDPDTNRYRVGGKKDVVTGTKFVIASAHTDEDNSTVVFDVAHCANPSPAAECELGMEMLPDILALVAGFTAVAYDNAMRGKHAQMAYREGLVPYFPGYKKRKNRDEGRLIQVVSARLKDGTTEPVKLYAYHYGAAILVPVGDSKEYVPLTMGQFRKRGKPGHHIWYADAHIPADERVPADLVGANLSYRLDTTPNDDKVGLKRTEVMHAHGPDTPEHKAGYEPRGGAESYNAWFKKSMRHQRARAIGKDSQYLDVVGSAIRRNLQSLIYERRRLAKAADPPIAA